MKELFLDLDRWQSQAEDIAIATLVRVRGSAPRGAGARLILTRSGKMAGSVSGGCVESDVYTRARQVMDSGQPEVAHYGIADGLGPEIGLSCGGSIDVLIEPFAATAPWHALRQAIERDRPAALAVALTPANLLGRALVVLEDGASIGSIDGQIDTRVVATVRRLQPEAGTTTCTVGESTIFVEAFAPQPHLYIVGATHTAVALCRMACGLGFRVTVIDPRQVYATPERFPEAAEIRCAWPEHALTASELDAYAYLVTLTHDRKFDLPALSQALRSEARYVGAMGSRSTTAKRAEELQRQGFTDADLARLHAPIGLDLGARTPEEIAVAILAEMVAVRHGRDGGTLRNKQANVHANS